MKVLWEVSYKNNFNGQPTQEMHDAAAAHVEKVRTMVLN